MTESYYWPEMGPWQKYRGLQKRLMSCFEAASIGVGVTDDIAADIAGAMTADKPAGATGDPRHEHHDLIRRMALVYGVTLLESMVKDYSRYLMLNDQLPATALDTAATPEEDSKIHWYYQDESLAALKLKIWRSQVRGWAYDIRDNDEQEFTDKGRQSKILKVIDKSAAAFEHWRVLLAAVGVRNCIIHSDGLMNAIQHRRTPLCEVDAEPSWDTALIYDVFTGLDLFNNQLSRLTLPDN